VDEPQKKEVPLEWKDGGDRSKRDYMLWILTLRTKANFEEKISVRRITVFNPSNFVVIIDKSDTMDKECS
jgi:hypothetical protein